MNKPRPPAPKVCGGVESLTPRETDVLRLMAQGLADKDIGRALGLSVSTIRTHASRIYAKLGIGNRVQALHAARRMGLLCDDEPRTAQEAIRLAGHYLRLAETMMAGES